MLWVVVVLVIVAVGVAAAFLVPRFMGTGGGGFRDLQRLANHRGWHFSQPDGLGKTFGLSAETMLRAADGSNMDWRVRWHLRASRDEGKDKTEIKCGDVLLESGYVFVNPRAEAPGIKAMQRAAAADRDDPVRKIATWKEHQSRAKEVPVGSPEFLDRYFVTTTVSEAAARRIVSQRVQKVVLGLPQSMPINIRAGADGVVLTTTAVFDAARIETLVSLEDMLISNVGQEQAVGSPKIPVPR